MDYSFINLISSSNNTLQGKILKIAISRYADGKLQHQFETFIKAVPALTKTEKEFLPFNYSNVRTAEPFCNVAVTIIEILRETQTIFKNKTEVSIFRKAFREIGLPVGNPSFILSNILKKELNFKNELPILDVLELLKLESSISNIMDECVAMEKIFSYLNQSKPSTLPTSQPEISILSSRIIDLHHLPNTPGVYFFRDSKGEVIYVGKAVDINKRVKSHFNSKNAFEKILYQATESVDFEETGSEIIALLVESHYIQYLKPFYNSQQIETINPFIITSKLDSKDILRIKPIQKTYNDTENEFYYNRESVIKTITEIQQKFYLCKRFSGVERSAGKCSDPIFCKGICQGIEDKEKYNLRVKEALNFISEQRPSYFIQLKGRNRSETGIVMVKQGIYEGYGFIDSDQYIGSNEDIEGFITKFTHNYFTSRIIDQYHKTRKRSLENIVYF